MQDPIQWPQLFSKVFPYLTLIPRRPSDSTDPLAIMWWDLSEDDFVRDSSVPVDFLGTVSPRRINEFRPFLVEIEKRVRELPPDSRSKGYRIFFTARALRDAFNRLSYPATLRDLTRQVVQVQRFYLESKAWFTFYVDMKSQFNSANPQ